MIKNVGFGIIIFDIEKISVDEVFAVLQPAMNKLKEKLAADERR